MAESAEASPSWFVRHAAVVGVLLLIAGLALTIAGQRMLTSEVRPPKQYIDGRYWTIDPASCAALEVNSRAACITLDSAKAAADERAHQNLVTIRSVGVLSVLTGIALVSIGFVGTRRAAERRR